MQGKRGSKECQFFKSKYVMKRRNDEDVFEQLRAKCEWNKKGGGGTKRISLFYSLQWMTIQKLKFEYQDHLFDLICEGDRDKGHELAWR